MRDLRTSFVLLFFLLSLSSHGASPVWPQSRSISSFDGAGREVYDISSTASSSDSLVVQNISVEPVTVNAVAAYRITFAVSESGELQAGEGHILVEFPENTFVPDVVDMAEVRVNAESPLSVIGNSGARTLDILVPSTLRADVAVELGVGVGILNPTLVGTYHLRVSTTSQGWGRTPAYSTTAAMTTISPGSVQATPSDVRLSAEYRIMFHVGAEGRLWPGESRIDVRFPAGTELEPGSSPSARVNGFLSPSVVFHDTLHMSILVPEGTVVPNSGPVEVVIPLGLVENPSLTGDYSLQVWTSVEPTPVSTTPYSITPFAIPLGGREIPRTRGGFSKPNQNKVFHHDGLWWVAARYVEDSDWYLWGFDNGKWFRDAFLHENSSARPDCHVERTADKLYVFVNHKSDPLFYRFSYVGRSWSVDEGYPVPMAAFTANDDDPVSMCRGKDGSIWLFRIENVEVQALVSLDDGMTWSVVLKLKEGLASTTGLTDATAFSIDGVDYVGVAYGVNAGGLDGFGFLLHRDGDLPNSWTDESEHISPFSTEASDDHVAIASTSSGEVYLATKSGPGGLTGTLNALYRRHKDGSWSKYRVKDQNPWTRIALILDEPTNRLFVLGTEPHGVGRFKSCPMGQEATLLSQGGTVVFENDGDEFTNISVPRGTGAQPRSLMVVSENVFTNSLWYNIIQLGDPVAVVARRDDHAVRDFVLHGNYPNPFNQGTVISFELPNSSDTRVQVYDVLGNSLTTMLNEHLPAGTYHIRWDGLDRYGRPAPSGTYFCRVRTGERTLVRRMSLVR